MRASVVDLRYRMKQVLAALERRERVIILHRGKVKGTIIPAAPRKAPGKVSEHPFFGMNAQDHTSVEQTMRRLRRARYT